MFPYPNDIPSITPEYASDLRVSGLIAKNLLLPETRIVFRPHKMLRAAMPEAAVYK